MKNKMIILMTVLLTLFLFAGCKNMTLERSSVLEKEAVSLYPAYVIEDAVKKWGYINEDGSFVIQPQYESADRFQPSGLAQISENGKWGLIDRAGKTVVKPQYWYGSAFAEKKYVFTDEQGQSYLIDEKGRTIFKTSGSIFELSCGLAAFRKDLGQDKSLWGYINDQGEVVIEAKYEWAQSFSGDKAVVKINSGHFAVIDKSGKILHEIRNKEIIGLSEDILIFSETSQDQSQIYGYLTLDGKLMLNAGYSDAQGFENGLAIVNSARNYGNAYGVINKNGEFIIPGRYSQITSLENGLFAVPLAQDYTFNNTFVPKALFDKNGRQLTDFKYYDLESLENGLISATDEKNTWLLDAQGNVVKDFPKAAGIGSIKPSGKLYKVEVDNQLAYLTREGRTVWSADNSIRFASGLQVKVKTFRPDRCMLIQYPEVAGLSDSSVEQKINSLLKKKFIGDYRASSKEGETYTETVEIGFTAQKNKNLLIISQNGYFYPIGAAHGQPYRADYHIDVSTGSLYTLQDLFKKDSQYNEKLIEIINQKIAKTNQQLSDQYYDGDIDSLDADKRFAVTKDALIIYFQPYEIACFAAGFPEFYFSWRDLTDIINQDGSFWKSFNKDLTAKAKNPATALEPEEKAKAEDAMKQYEKNIIEAVNRNDFSLVEPWLYPESSLYASQQKLVADLNRKGIKERLNSYSVAAIEADNLGVIRAYVTEDVAVQYPGKEYQRKKFQWVYSLKYNYDINKYQLTYLEKWEK